MSKFMWRNLKVFCKVTWRQSVSIEALYGLKQAPRSWYRRIGYYLQDLGFKKILSESTLYLLSKDIMLLWLYIYIIIMMIFL